MYCVKELYIYEYVGKQEWRTSPGIACYARHIYWTLSQDEISSLDIIMILFITQILFSCYT